MKLPKNKKERMQILGVAVIGAVGILYLAVDKGISPLLKNAKIDRDRIAALNVTLTEIRKDAKSASRFLEENEQIKTELRKIDEHCILKPEYNNYLLKAKAQIEQAAAAHGVKLTSDALEAGKSEIPVKRPKKSVLQTYAVQVVASATYEDLTDMIAAIETNNPYISISSLQVTANDMNHRKHLVSFKVVWPIWEDQNIVSNFQAVAESAEPSAAGEPAAGQKHRERH